MPDNTIRAKLVIDPSTRCIYGSALVDESDERFIGPDKWFLTEDDKDKWVKENAG